MNGFMCIKPFISYDSIYVIFILKLSAIPGILETVAKEIIQNSSPFLVQWIYQSIHAVFCTLFTNQIELNYQQTVEHELWAHFPNDTVYHSYL